jgi:hypothetical protein
VSRLTGIPFAQLQDWRELGWSLGTAALAGAVAWFSARHFLSEQQVFLRVIAGTAVLAAAYAGMNYRKFLR